MKRTLFFLLMLAVTVLACGSSFAQEAGASPAAPQAAPPALTAREEMLQRWATVRKDLESKNLEAAKADLKELEGRCLDLGITSFEELSASMVKQGKALLDAREVGGALALFDSAARISPNYPPVYYAKGWAYLVQDKMKILMTLDAFLEGFTRSLNDFWWSFFYTGNKITSLLFTLSAAFSLFGLFMALRYSPLLAHDIAETLKKKETEQTIKYIMLPAVYTVVLMVLGYWWAVCAVFLSLWVYFNKREKTLAIAFFALLIFMPDVMTNFAKFAQAGGNKFLWVMDEVNKGRTEDGTGEYLSDVLRDDPDNENALMALAQFDKKKGRFEEAAQVYDRLSVLKPGIAIYRNNLGNARFLQGDLKGAIREYSSAIQNDPEDVLPYFNLSQVYGEALMFTERDKTDLQARELDPAAVAEFRDRAGTTPVRMVFDEPVPVKTFWRLAFADTTSSAALADSLWTTSVKVLPLRGARVAGVAFIVLAFGVDALRRRGVYSHFCSKCLKVSCRKCQKPYYSKDLCAECHQIFVRMEGVEARDRVRKMLEAREKQRSVGLVYRISSMLLPGSGHFLTGHPLRGFLFLGIFVLLIKDIFFSRFYEVPYDFTLPILRPDTLLMGIFLVLFYLLAQLDTHRITK